MKALRWISFLAIALILAVICRVFTLEMAAVIFIVGYVWNAIWLSPIISLFEIDIATFVAIVLSALSGICYVIYITLFSEQTFSWSELANYVFYPFIIWEYGLMPMFMRWACRPTTRKTSPW